MELIKSRLLWNVLPTVAVVAILYLAVWGENGLIKQRELSRDAERAEYRLAAVRAENAVLEREIVSLRTDASSQRRAAAEELLLVPPHSTVYRFASNTP
jgi:cell division protein FtsB